MKDEVCCTFRLRSIDEKQEENEEVADDGVVVVVVETNNENSNRNYFIHSDEMYFRLEFHTFYVLQRIVRISYLMYYVYVNSHLTSMVYCFNSHPTASQPSIHLRIAIAQMLHTSSR